MIRQYKVSATRFLEESTVMAPTVVEAFADSGTEARKTIHPGSTGHLRIAELTAGLNPADPSQAQVIDALKSFDADGDGTMSVEELIKVGERRVYNEKKIKNLRKMVVAVVIACFVFSGVMLGLMIAANEASKDDKPDEDGTLKTISGEYVSTTETQSEVYLKELASVDPKELVNMRHVYLQTEGGVWRLYSVTGYDWYSSSHIEVFTMRGDIIRIMNEEVVIITGTGQTLKVNSRRRSLLADADTVTVAGGGIKANTGTGDAYISTTKQGSGVLCALAADCLAQGYTNEATCTAGVCIGSRHIDSDSDTDSDTDGN